MMSKPPANEKMLCYCKNVNYGQVRESIKKLNAAKVSEVQADCRAGTGCRTCIPEIEELLAVHKQENPGFLTSLFRRIFFWRT
jgi:NAD(P)H-nitrite reductase large subunit